MLTSFWTRIFDLAAPRLCPICRQRLAPSESTLCAACHMEMPLTHYEEQPYDNQMAQRFWSLVPIERAAALVFYPPQSAIARLIYDMKYFDRPDIGYHLGRIMARQFATHDFFLGVDAIVPTPLTRKRQWHRGYNQSLMIARGIASSTGLPVYNKVVRRIRFDASQTALNTKQRMENTEGVFQLVRPDRVAGRHLLLVDDIMTTGATLLSLAGELQKATDVRFSIATLGYTKS